MSIDASRRAEVGSWKTVGVGIGLIVLVASTSGTIAFGANASRSPLWYSNNTPGENGTAPDKRR